MHFFLEAIIFAVFKAILRMMHLRVLLLRPLVGGESTFRSKSITWVIPIVDAFDTPVDLGGILSTLIKHLRAKLCISVLSRGPQINLETLIIRVLVRAILAGVWVTLVLFLVWLLGFI